MRELAQHVSVVCRIWVTGIFPADVKYLFEQQLEMICCCSHGVPGTNVVRDQYFLDKMPNECTLVLPSH